MDHLPPLLRNVFDSVGSPLGLETSFAAFLVLLLANLIVAFVFRYIRSGTLRMIISLCVGLLWSYIMYDVQNTISLLTISGFFYIISIWKILPPYLVTTLAIGILSYFHIYRMINDYMGYSLDVSGPLMLFTAKYSMFSFDLHDGEKLNNKLPLSANERVEKERKLTCLVQTPSVLEYYAYIFDFLGFIAGPVFHMKDYLDFLYLKGDFENLNEVSFIGVVAERFCYALLVGALFSYAGTIEPLNFRYIETPEYSKLHVLTKVMLFHAQVSAGRLRYYFAWYMSDVACCISGIGYTPRNPTNKFSRGQNAVIFKVDFANNQGELLAHWNISISNWLKNCIYLRAIESPPKFINAKTYATILTRFASAFWHGFYPGYYLTFLSAVLQTEVDTVARKYIKPLFIENGEKEPHWSYTYCGKIHTAFCLNYYASAFLVLSAAKAIQLWKNVFFYFHIINFVSIFAIPFVCKKMFKVKPTEDKYEKSSVPDNEEKKKK